MLLYILYYYYVINTIFFLYNLRYNSVCYLNRTRTHHVFIVYNNYNNEILTRIT